MNNELSPENANRLAIGIARSRRISYQAAEAYLKSLSLRIVATPDFCATAAGQAAVLTAVNTAQRAYLGGVNMEVPQGIPLKLKIFGATTLDQALTEVSLPSRSDSIPKRTLFLGVPSSAAQTEDVRVYCDGWRGGVSDVGDQVAFDIGDAEDICLGGIFAGAAGVHRCFLKDTNLPAQNISDPFGISLAGLDADWLQPIRTKQIEILPSSFWMLGLGHLGQAYLWTLSMLPFGARADIHFLLNDFDKIDDSNLGAGLLCKERDVGKMKTRHCADWLEANGFSTSICERSFGANTVKAEDEPDVALCGFDKAEPRRSLDRCGFGLVLECGLGGTLADFDQAEFHRFPRLGRSASDIWAITEAPQSVPAALAALFEGGKKQNCGQVAIDIAGKSVSTSFVGAMASAIAVSEVIRAFHRKACYDNISFNPRCQSDLSTTRASKPLTAIDIGALGFTSKIWGSAPLI